MITTVSRKWFWLFLFAAAVWAAAGRVSFAHNGIGDQPEGLKGVGIEEHLGAQLPMNTVFQDETGQAVSLKSFFSANRPVVLNFVYFNCPMLCSFVENGLTDGLKGLPFGPGDRFEVLSISIDPKDTFKAAAAYKTKYVGALGKAGAQNGWHFLVGTPESIKKATEAIGFKYQYNEKSGEFYHAAATYILSPDGKISRYLYGIEYSPFDLKLSILEASQKKTVSSLERVLLFCYNYDPQSHKYVLYAMNLMRAAGLFTILALVILFGVLKLKERSQGQNIE